MIAKVAATVLAGSLLALGGVGWKTSHEITELKHARDDTKELLTDIRADVRATREDASEIAKQVAVLEERTKFLEPR